ncbi:MAG: hypothetical protein J5I93_15980, partial [Pirellulaceae bacterium]|nr:hypothetical protein [Pirellulaceae bacterium]
GGEAAPPPDALALPRSQWQDLDAIVLKALEKDRTRRYSTAAELADDIRRFLAHEPIRARRATTWGRLRRWTRRNPKVAALLALVALLTAVSAGVFLVLTLRLGFELARAESAERSASASRTLALDQLWRSYADQVRAARLSQQQGQQVRSLSLLGKASEIVRSLPQSGGMEAEGIRVLRNEAIACLALPDLRLDRQWKLDTPRKLTQAFDARDGRYAYVDAQGDVQVRDMLDNATLATFTPDQPVEVLRLDDSGQTLGGMSYLSSRNKCYLWDLDQRELQAELPHEATDLSLAFGGDGRYLAAGLWNGQVRLYRRPDLSLVRSLLATAWPHQIALAPGASRVAVSCATDHQVQVVGVDEYFPLTALEHPAGVHGIAWNPAGSRLAAGCDDSRIYVWDVAARQVQSVLEGHEAGGIHVSFDPWDELLASHALDGTTRLWDCRTGKELVRARTSGVYRWSADGRYLLGGTTEYAERWEVVRGASRRTLYHGPPGNQRRRSSAVGPWSLEFDPTGQLLASADYDGVRLWSVADGRQLAHLPLGPHGLASFHPAGDLLTVEQGQLARWPLAFRRDEQAPSSTAAIAQRPGPVTSGLAIGWLAIGPPRASECSLGNPFPSGPVAHDQAGTTMAWANRADDQVVVWRMAEAAGGPRRF